MAGCYYDNEEELFPLAGGECDTTTVAYGADIVPIMITYCTRCHQNDRSDGGVNIENYALLKPYVDNGQLLGTIRHENSFQAMPPSGGQIPACDIQKIAAWIAIGAPNN